MSVINFPGGPNTESPHAKRRVWDTLRAMREARHLIMAMDPQGPDLENAIKCLAEADRLIFAYAMKPK